MKLYNVLMLVGVLLYTGCSTAQVKPKELAHKNKDLPSWVNDDFGMVAVGSATYRGQSYIQQKNQAVAVASMNLGRKIKVKVDSLTQDYYRSMGEKSPAIDVVTTQITSQVSSEILSGVSVKNIFIAEDGEMFVQIVLDNDSIANYIIGDANMKKYMSTQLAAEKGFKDLKQEVKEFRQEL